MRVEEAARYLRLGRSKTYQLVASGELPAVRLGRRSLRVPSDALERWVRDRTSGGQVAEVPDAQPAA